MYFLLRYDLRNPLLRTRVAATLCLFQRPEPPEAERSALGSRRRMPQVKLRMQPGPIKHHPGFRCSPVLSVCRFVPRAVPAGGLALADPEGHPDRCGDLADLRTARSCAGLGGFAGAFLPHVCWSWGERGGLPPAG